MKLQSLAENRDNNFTLLRMIAATAVLWSHSFPLALGNNKEEPLYSIIGKSAGGVAVDIFFITSGFLIYRSFSRNPNLISYAKARILRVYPALLLTIFTTVFILGPIFTNLSLVEYFTDNQTFRYLIKNSILLRGVEYTLPGVFEGNIYPKAVNGSLWTLPYELRMYGYLALLGYGCNRLRARFRIDFSKWAFPVVFLISAALDYSGTVPPIANSKSLHLFSMFFAGATLYSLRRSITLSSRLAFLFALSLPLSFTCSESVFDILYLIALPYLTLFFAYIPSGKIRLYNRLGDYSYGIYIFAFPTQQIIEHHLPGISPWAMSLISTPIVFILGIISWHLIEYRALQLKDHPRGRLA